MPRLTTDQFNALPERLKAVANAGAAKVIQEHKTRPVLAALVADEYAVDAGRELELHNDIIRLCRARGWVYVHSDPTKKTTNQRGTTDFIIGASRCRTLWVECKAKNKKRTKEQEKFANDLVANGHFYLLCRSLRSFARWAEYAGVKCRVCGLGWARGLDAGGGADLCDRCFHDDP